LGRGFFLDQKGTEAIVEPTPLSTRQLAEALGVSESSVKRWVDEGEIAATRTAGGHRRIPVSAAVGFMRSHRVRPAKPHLLNLAEPPALGEVDAGSCDALKKALLANDGAIARGIICGRFMTGAPIASIGDNLLRPVLEGIGEIWRHDALGILIEHRAVQSCIQALSQISAWIPEPAPGAPAAVVAAGPADPYLLPPLLAFLTLKECGMSGSNLGALTPLSTLELAIGQYDAALCAVSVSVPQDPKTMPAWNTLQALAVKRGCALVVGGRCLATLASRLAPTTQAVGTMAELAAFAKGLVEGAQRPRAKPARQKKKSSSILQPSRGAFRRVRGVS